MRLLLLLTFPIYIFSMGCNDYDVAFHLIKMKNLKKLKEHFVPRSVPGVNYKRTKLDPDQFIYGRGTPLAYAAFIGNMDIFKFLFKQSVDPDKPGFVDKNKEALTPFQVALSCERIEIARFLIKKKVVSRRQLQRVDSKESILIARIGNTKIAKKLLKAK